MYYLCFYVPLDAAEQVKEAVFAAGGGKYENYEKCSFEMEGIGQFLPTRDANPTIGELNKIERVKELRVELICEKTHIKEAVEALIKAHPYEEPAYHLFKMHTLKDL